MRRLSVAAANAALCVTAFGQPASDADRPPAIPPLASEPASRLIFDAPLAGLLARGVVIVQFRTEHFRVMPVFGKVAVELSPRVGHPHVTVDDTPGTWAHTSADPIIVVGRHQARTICVKKLADLATGIVAFIVPDLKAPASQRQ